MFMFQNETERESPAFKVFDSYIDSAQKDHFSQKKESKTPVFDIPASQVENETITDKIQRRNIASKDKVVSQKKALFKKLLKNTNKRDPT